MNVVSYATLREFAAKHSDAKSPLDVWYHIVKRKNYEMPNQVKADFGSADFLSGNRVVFDIGGNKYRLVVKMEYAYRHVYIRHVVTHEEYDRLSKSGSL